MKPIDQLTAEEVATLQVKVPVRGDYWIVIAADRSHWAMPSYARGLYVTQEAAEEKAQEVLAGGAFLVVKIVKIPGDQ